MGDLIHQSRITITREKGPTRIAQIEGFSEPVYYGVHGGISKYYNVTPEEEHAATIDHIVGAIGGWMMGTLASVMAGKKIRTFTDRFVAFVTGDIEEVSGIPKITRINVNYLLKLPDKLRDSAIECFNNYIEFCPAAQSVIGCIEINHNLEMETKED